MDKLTVPCPHCHALTCSYSPSAPDAPDEIFSCSECGYHHWAGLDLSPNAPKASDNVRSLGTPARYCTVLRVRRPPYLRWEYVRGGCPASRGRPAFISPTLWRALIDGLSELGERPYGHYQEVLFTTSLEGHPGFRQYIVELHGDSLEVYGASDVLLLTVFPSFTMLAPNAKFDNRMT